MSIEGVVNEIRYDNCMPYPRPVKSPARRPWLLIGLCLLVGLGAGYMLGNRQGYQKGKTAGLQQAAAAGLNRAWLNALNRKTLTLTRADNLSQVTDSRRIYLLHFDGGIGDKLEVAYRLDDGTVLVADLAGNLISVAHGRP